MPQIVVASTEPAGMPPATNCIATQPQAISEMAIQTPPASRTISRTSSSAEISIIAIGQTPLAMARSTISSSDCGGGFS
ncbi:hypothetical protein QO058_23705 [Bosea vestrisii]|uniref:hypothetical protein n=1 Tax=Bosea vestrisii TaxID=151416 RepID=UPI0024DF93DF|nr:hypothetical protein [Bosea vestrisii]WID99651.1 hypothetical protein QO058_23705 [Bosea vestrisii]